MLLKSSVISNISKHLQVSESVGHYIRADTVLIRKMKVWKTKCTCPSVDAGNCVKLRAKFTRNRKKKDTNSGSRETSVFGGFAGAAAAGGG